MVGRSTYLCDFNNNFIHRDIENPIKNLEFFLSANSKTHLAG